MIVVEESIINVLVGGLGAIYDIRHSKNKLERYIFETGPIAEWLDREGTSRC